MREILFRGRRLDNGEWVYGYVFTLFDRPVIKFGESDKELVGVIPETVGEFTGLTDTAGNKIFEGDIVKITDEIVNGTYYARVEFGNPNAQYNWGFQLVPMCKTPFAVDILHWVEMEESGAFIEVIGNVYDNAELLGETK